MGNVLRGFSKRERRFIKIKKVDGTVMNLRGPAYVKEVACDYPNHGVFEAGSVRRPVDLSRPLPHIAELRTGDLYLLIPLVSGENEGLCKEELMVDKMKSSIVSSKIVSACENGSTVRLTIRLSKKEAASLVRMDGKEVITKKLVPSFSLSTMERQQKKLSEWKPSLEPIAENHSSDLPRSLLTHT